MQAASRVGSFKMSAPKLPTFDMSKRDENKKLKMEQAIKKLSKKEKELAEKYFSIIDKNQDGFLTKLELQVMSRHRFCL